MSAASVLLNDVVWFLGVIVSAVGAIGALAIMVSWAIDRFLKATNLTREFLYWYAEKLKRTRKSG